MPTVAIAVLVWHCFGPIDTSPAGLFRSVNTGSGLPAARLPVDRPVNQKGEGTNNVIFLDLHRISTMRNRTSETSTVLRML